MTEGGNNCSVRPRQFVHRDDKKARRKRQSIMSQFDGCCYYEVFQVDKDASVEIIRKAYRKLSLMHHPDRSTTPVTFITSLIHPARDISDILWGLFYNVKYRPRTPTWYFCHVVQRYRHNAQFVFVLADVHSRIIIPWAPADLVRSCKA